MTTLEPAPFADMFSEVQDFLGEVRKPSTSRLPCLSLSVESSDQGIVQVAPDWLLHVMCALLQVSCCKHVRVNIRPVC